jgi:hypothetical protein
VTKLAIMASAIVMCLRMGTSPSALAEGLDGGVRLLSTRTDERGLLMRDTMDGALFWWMGALATGIVVAAAALMS